MDDKELLKVDNRQLIEEVYQNKGLISEYLLEMETGKGAYKFAVEKAIRAISLEKPLLLYPYMERIALLLDSNNSFIRWGTYMTIANLLSVDVEKKWLNIRVRYMRAFDKDELVEFSNAAKGTARIIAAYPEEEDELMKILLSIDSHEFLYKGESSPECNNVVRGHIIDIFEETYEKSKYKKEIEEFMGESLLNSRKSVRAGAAKFLRKHKI